MAGVSGCRKAIFSGARWDTRYPAIEQAFYKKKKKLYKKDVQQLFALLL